MDVRKLFPCTAKCHKKYFVQMIGEAAKLRNAPIASTQDFSLKIPLIPQ